MKKYVCSVVVLVAAACIFVSFFMIWVRVETTASRISKELAGAVGTEGEELGRYAKRFDKVASELGGVVDIKATMTLRGYQIPQLARKGDSKLLKSVASLGGFETGDYQRKSNLVYLVPLSALICFFLAILGLRNRFWVLIIVVISGVAAGGGFYKILTVNLKELPADITIGPGIWTILYSFLVMFLISLAWFFSKAKSKST